MADATKRSQVAAEVIELLRLKAPLALMIIYVVWCLLFLVYTCSLLLNYHRYKIQAHLLITKNIFVISTVHFSAIISLTIILLKHSLIDFAARLESSQTIVERLTAISIAFVFGLALLFAIFVFPTLIELLGLILAIQRMVCVCCRPKYQQYVCNNFLKYYVFAAWLASALYAVHFIHYSFACSSLATSRLVHVVENSQMFVAGVAALIYVIIYRRVVKVSVYSKETSNAEKYIIWQILPTMILCSIRGLFVLNFTLGRIFESEAFFAPFLQISYYLTCTFLGPSIWLSHVMSRKLFSPLKGHLKQFRSRLRSIFKSSITSNQVSHDDNA